MGGGGGGGRWEGRGERGLREEGERGGRGEMEGCESVTKGVMRGYAMRVCHERVCQEGVS